MAKKKKNKVKLLPHESEAAANGKLTNISHEGATSVWLHGTSTDETLLPSGKILCYRHMGDIEFAYLLEHNQLPSTQPYQTLTRGQEGRQYCESYLRSNKFVDTSPTTVVEFECNETLIDNLYAIQRKPEDGKLSHGLGSKAGNTLPLFNSFLENGEITWRVVLVKRKVS